jgi:hypothetical protein
MLKSPWMNFWQTSTGLTSIMLRPLMKGDYLQGDIFTTVRTSLQRTSTYSTPRLLGASRC